MTLYDPRRIPRSLVPENQEFPMLALHSRTTPESLHYIRSHFPYPSLPPVNEWRLDVEGAVRRPLRLSYADLLKWPSVTLPVTLECSGNKRAFFLPKVRGEQWELGAVSDAEWSGVRLRDLLLAAEVKGAGIEAVFEGMDAGTRPDMPGTFAFARSLPLGKALHPDTLVALRMNGNPIPFKHGSPARLIVPGWYGMASVKWLRRITVVDRPFAGPFQTVDYVVESADKTKDPRPVTVMKVNAAIAQPTDQQVLHEGIHRVYGVAWSGEHTVQQLHIHLRSERGASRHTAAWLDPETRYRWRRWIWEWHVTEAGVYRLSATATDSGGNTQPEQAEWNRKGYENNSVHEIQVYIETNLE